MRRNLENQGEMGGCRCTFRGCDNSTVINPKMHFFHFPYKDVARCKKWAANSGNLDFLDLPDSKLRNKVVCEDHFQDHCFMNFKKERLIKTAVPNLIKLNNGQVEIYNHAEDEDDEPQPVSTQIDLPNPDIVPDAPKLLNKLDYDPIFDDIELKTVLPKRKPNNVNEKPPIPPLKRKKAEQQLFDIIEPSSSYEAGNTADNVIDTFNVSIDLEGSHSESEIILPDMQKHKNVRKVIGIKSNVTPPDIRKNMLRKVKIERNEDLVQQTAYVQKIRTADVTNTPVIHVLNERVVVTPFEPKADRSLPKVAQSPASDKVDKVLYLQTMAEHAKQIDELKNLLTQKLSNDNQNGQSGTPTSSTTQSDVRLLKVEKGPALNKAQLFNGVRKYLNQSMVALLRMQMFGSTDREYRSDEKQFSKELFNLNNVVYDYMRDEMRFHLPPKNDVETWLNSPEDEELLEV